MGAKLKAAIIGCGRMAGTIDDEVQDHAGMLFPYGHAPAYKLVADVDLVGAADIDAARLASFASRFGIPQQFTDYREMLHVVKPDIVSVTTRATVRAQIVLDAVEAGAKAIYAEKALACSLAETDAIASACRAAGVAFNVGTSRRFHPGYRKARELAGQGLIGKVYGAVAYVPSDGLMHTHSHTLDTLLFLLGDPAVSEVQGRLRISGEAVQEDRLLDDPAVEWAHVHCEGGRRADLLTFPGRYEFEVSGSDGAILIYNNGYGWHIRRPGQARQGQRPTWDFAPFPTFDRSVSPTLRAVKELVEAIKEGKPTSGNLAVAGRQMEVGLAVVQSHLAEGRSVTLPLARRDFYVPSR